MQYSANMNNMLNIMKYIDIEYPDLKYFDMNKLSASKASLCDDLRTSIF